MDTRSVYNQWASRYDEDENKTRDTEARAVRAILDGTYFDRILEIGCGTGKNTGWLQTICNTLVAVDFSEVMLTRAREKIISPKVSFIQADILAAWSFTAGKFDLVTFSLVLEHIPALDPVFKKASDVLQDDGMIYIGELHPLRQASGSKAGFGEGEKKISPSCYDHSMEEYHAAAQKNGLTIRKQQDFLAHGDQIPRVLALLLSK